MYIKIDIEGNYEFYDEDIHSKEIIEQCTKIDDSLYNYLLENNGKLVFDTTKTNIIKENFIARVYEDLEEDIKPTNEERIDQLENMILMMLGGEV
ncbi:hypothetical protein [Senegalia massiliensis]|uniref:hypothetical protein n=1 Tax=Senegalia massiliensis TaxID=1720316 RepID=UPI00102F4DA3|nr:hypothetical protein [Senegalia massiliensis]